MFKLDEGHIGFNGTKNISQQVVKGRGTEKNTHFLARA